MSTSSTPFDGHSTAASSPAVTTAPTIDAVAAVGVSPPAPRPSPTAPQSVTYLQPQVLDQPQPQPQHPRVLGPLQPLPRGRPPRQRAAAPPGLCHTSSTASPPYFFNGSPDGSPVSQMQEPFPQFQQSKQQAPPEPSYTRGGHLIGGFNPARYAGVSSPYPRFSPQGKLLILTGANSLRSWVSQVEYVARHLNCYQELTKKFNAYPKPSTVQLFICETRYATAWRVLEGSIAGPVWAYMRVLGYSSIEGTGEELMSPQPADCFEYAKRAASRILVPGTPDQPLEERKRMVDEVLMAQSTDYPSERCYKKGIKWLRLACDNLIKQGDYDLAVSLYEPIPEWAPKPPGYNETTTPVAPAAESDSSSHRRQSQSQGTPDASVAEDSGKSTEEVANSESVVDPAGSAGPATTGHSTSPLPKLIADTPSAKKRKRMPEDEGSETAPVVIDS